MKNPKPEILSVSTVANSRLFTTEEVQLRFANGQQARFERLCGSGAVMVIAVSDEHVYMIREYAVGVEDYLLGFVKGRLEAGESPVEGANREIQEGQCLAIQRDRRAPRSDREPFLGLVGNE